MIGLYLRALRICSPLFLNEEFKYIEHSIQSLKYPKFFTLNARKKALKIHSSNKPKKTNPTIPITHRPISLPTIKHNITLYNKLAELGIPNIQIYIYIYMCVCVCVCVAERTSTVMAVAYFHSIRMTYPIQPKQHKNGESLPNYFFLRSFRTGRTYFLSAPFVAVESQHHEESRLIYGTFESTLLDQGFPVEHELDACNRNPLMSLSLKRNVSRSDKQPLQFCLPILETFILLSKIYRTTNYWQQAKGRLNTFIPIFLLTTPTSTKGLLSTQVL